MKLCEFSLASAMLCLLVSPIFAQGGDFFWSFESNGPVNEDVSRKDFSVGDTGSLFLYYTTNGPAMSELNTGAFLDLATSNSGVVEFTAAETFDFDVALASDTSIVFGTRWGNSFGAGDVSDDGQSASINAFTVGSGDGIVNANNGTGPFLDLGYDQSADAWLFGRLDFTIIGNGNADIITTPGAGGIVNNGETVDVTFGGATLGTVPEPSAALLIGLVGIGLGCRRRR